MKLAPLLRRSATADPMIVNDEPADLRHLWDELRAAAQSEAERQEIDALFSRSMP
jgi:hypothetical protein